MVYLSNIVKDLLNAIKILIDNNIQYSKFKLPDLMMDKHGNIKLLSVCHASLSNDIQIDNYLGNIGKIIIQL